MSWYDTLLMYTSQNYRQSVKRQQFLYQLAMIVPTQELYEMLRSISLLVMRHENSCTNHIFTWRLTVTGGEALLKMGSTVARE
ncbi:hypothetical protein Plhal304r1_c056g0141831 [Plasmopara halstedii]